MLRAERQTRFDAAVVAAPAVRTYDVAVVGMGPTGSVAAALLAQAGLRVYACDRVATQPETRSPVTLDDDVLRVLNQIGALGMILPHLQSLAGLDCCGVAGQLIYRSRRPRYPDTRARHRTYVLCQGDLERALATTCSTTSSIPSASSSSTPPKFHKLMTLINLAGPTLGAGLRVAAINGGSALRQARALGALSQQSSLPTTSKRLGSGASCCSQPSITLEKRGSVSYTRLRSST